mmetsp:Transcript_65354/g.76793  ORF Transcript_65354/g.76793 Transcript_65354/m.76793 type:complete len:107 (+) Transcript_65354:1344-1664(+)
MDYVIRYPKSSIEVHLSEPKVGEYGTKRSKEVKDSCPAYVIFEDGGEVVCPSDVKKVKEEVAPVDVGKDLGVSPFLQLSWRLEKGGSSGWIFAAAVICHLYLSSLL